MTSIRWIKRGLKIDFLKIKNIATILSVIAIISSLFFLVYKNLNFGIDFKGGTLIELKKDNNLTIAEIRSQLSGLNIGDIQIQTFGSDNIILIRIENSSNLVANADMNTIELIRSNLEMILLFKEQRLLAQKLVLN